MLLMFLLIGASGAFYYFFIYKKKEETPSPSPPVSETSSPPVSQTSSPLDTLLASGQKLEDDEFDAGAGKRKVTYQPTIADRTKVIYSISMDINIVKAFPETGLFPLLQNTNNYSFPIGTTERRPKIWISGSYHADGKNRVVVNHVSTNGANESKLLSSEATIGTYFNLTYVVTDGKLTSYINGVKDSNGEYSAAFTWSTGTDEWTWNQWNTLGVASIKVKNAYFFNKALTLSEVELIGKKQTSGTSTYVMPPKYNGASESYSLQPSIKMCDI